MKFKAFKENLVKENEKKYGVEIREKYGDEEVDGSNQKLLGMNEAEYERFRNLEAEINKTLKEAVEAGADLEGEDGRNVVLLHKEWLKMTWKQYSAQAHKGLASMYLADERFMQYYDKEAEGCAEFLVAAIQFWADKI